MSLRTLLLVVGIVVAAVPSIAAAPSVFGCSALPGYCGYYPWSTYASESVPYYSLHPPVYYSFRVARPYGYSPFPYPPGVLTPAAETPQPVVVRNQYLPRDDEEGMEVGRQAQPLRIQNPFVEHSDRAVSKRPNSTPHHPLVVYPAALATLSKKSG
jgi:hypothetical protein